MKWVVIDRLHINTDNVTRFHWIEGQLYVIFPGEDKYTVFRDPDRKKYLRLCGQLGVRPVEVEADGKS